MLSKLLLPLLPLLLLTTQTLSTPTPNPLPLQLQVQVDLNLESTLEPPPASHNTTTSTDSPGCDPTVGFYVGNGCTPNNYIGGASNIQCGGTCHELGDVESVYLTNGCNGYFQLTGTLFDTEGCQGAQQKLSIPNRRNNVCLDVSLTDGARSAYFYFQCRHK